MYLRSSSASAWKDVVVELSRRKITTASSSLMSAWMHSLLVKHLRLHIAGAFTVCLGVEFFSLKFAVGESGKKAYAVSYTNCDSVKDLEEMRKAGVFQSAE